MGSDLTQHEWRKSSRSGGGNDCVELAVRTDGTAVRDSKNTAAGQLALTRSGWAGFLGTVKDGQLDLA